MLYGPEGMSLSDHAADEHRWADGSGAGDGGRWMLEQDDSVTFYFDPDNSRDEYFSNSDRAIGVNIGNRSDPETGTGPVQRWKFVKGDDIGSAIGVNQYGLIDPDIDWASTYVGTINDSSDTDGGWTTEIFMPWASINMDAPSHGQTIGMNFDVIFDQEGGERDFTNNSGGADRFTKPAFVDDHVQGAHSSYVSSQAGLHGPVNYAEVMFIDPSSSAQPATITDLAAAHPSAFGAVLTFTAPTGTQAGLGHVSSYQIRYSTDPITDQTWDAATEFAQVYVPRLAGLSERLRLVELTPGTTYHVAVRGVDANGAVGDLSNVASFTTDQQSSSSDRGRLVPSPAGSTLMFENGEPFVPVGEHLGLSWGYYRSMYDANVWDAAGQMYHNYHENPPVEGTVGAHLDNLAAHGVNTLRVFIEMLVSDQTGNPNNPEGRYWIEYPAGTYNPAMKQFVLDALAEAAARDMYLIFSPFDTFAWPDVFNETALSSANGGPLDDLNDFFQNPQTITLAKNRLSEVMGWVAQSSYGDHLIGWEPMNEWDSWGWTLNAEGVGEAGRETEMRTRAAWMRQLSSYVREQDPDHLVLSSTTSLAPNGPVARLLLYDRAFDVLAPHLYTNAGMEPINTPDADKAVRAATENARLTAYWQTSRIDQRPILHGEWGLFGARWPNGRVAYSSAYTQAQDEALYRAVQWSGLASGQTGSGLRMSSSALTFNYQAQTDAMHDTELAISTFMADTSLPLDWTHFAAHPLLGNISAGSDKSLLAWGTTDGAQGVAYILQNGNQSSGWVTDGVLTIDGLDDGLIVSAEVWRADTATRIASTDGLLVLGGRLSMNLPAFTTDVAVKFKAVGRATLVPLDDTTGDGSTTGSIDDPSQRSMFALVPPGPGAISISITGQIEGVIELYDASGTLLDSGASVTGIVAEDETVYAVVSSTSGTGSYTLSADAAGEGDDDHADTRDYTSATAVSLDTAGDAHEPGQLEGPRDTDLFRYTAAGTGQATISATGITDGLVKLYDSDGQLIASGSSVVYRVLHTFDYYVQVESQSGQTVTGYTLSIAGPNTTDPHAADIGGRALVSARSGGDITITTLNGDGAPIALQDASNHSAWSGAVLTDLAGGPAPSDTSDTWVDPKDDLVYVATPSPDGLMLYAQTADGSWTRTNLTESLGGAGQGVSPIVRGLTHFISPDLQRDFSGKLIYEKDADGIIVTRPDGSPKPLYDIPAKDRNNVTIAGLNADGQLVMYSQRRVGTSTVWTFKNVVRDDLEPNGRAMPAWVGPLVGYVTPWNAPNIAGLNANGELVVVWTSPTLGFEYRTANLTASQGTPRLVGGLSVYTNWGINITGVLEDGSLGVTWWSPALRQQVQQGTRTSSWAFSNLTTMFSGPTVRQDSVATYTTPNWPGNNIVALTTDNELTIYWWTPSNLQKYGQGWMIANLGDILSDAEMPVGRLDAVAAKDSTFTVAGVAEDGEVLRYFWSAASGWTFENATLAIDSGASA
jgi:hypothetical protein